MCALRIHELGVKNVFIGLQYQHFWKHTSLSNPFPKHHPNTSVLILKRDNYLSHYCAGAGPDSKNFDSFIPMLEIKYLPSRIEEYQKRYKKMYCSLKKAGVKVKVITYEELVGDFDSTMRKVGEFVGESVDRGWKLGGFESKHVALKERVKNYEEAKRYLKRKHPQYLCLLREDCDFFPFPDFECEESSFSSSFFPLSSNSTLPKQAHKTYDDLRQKVANIFEKRHPKPPKYSIDESRLTKFSKKK